MDNVTELFTREVISNSSTRFTAFNETRGTSLEENSTTSLSVSMEPSETQILVDTYNRLGKFSLSFSLLMGLTVVIAMVSLFANAVVFSTLTRVPKKVLRSRVLVMSTLVADIMFPLLSSAEVFKFVILAYGIRDGHSMTCLEFFGNSVTLLAQFSQSLATLVLAVDRAYAVISPMTYHMVGYPRKITVLILAFTWLLPFGMFTTYATFQYFTPMRIPPGFCYKLKIGTKPAFITFPFTLAIAFSLTTFATYVGIIIILQINKLRNKAVSSVQSESLKKIVSLVVTYFLVLLTSMTLYLPAPFFKIFVQFARGRQLNRKVIEIVLRCLANLNYMNSVVDPIIFASRIPSIRRGLPEPLQSWLWIRRQGHPADTTGTSQTTG